MLQTCLVLLVLRLSRAYDNIAFNKPAWQLHQFIPDDDRFNASNAVDGRKSDLRAWRGQCAISDNDQRTATWRVDLQNILSIRHITIYYRTENAAWDSTNQFSGRFLGFTLHISNTTERADGELCFHDTNYTRDTIPAVLNVTCPVHGQYVIYYNERKQEGGNPDGYSQYAFNELCEVEVYGCPVPGYYGPDCSIPCPDTCRYCHIETGVCQGCKPGYQGHQCELQCDGLKYGAGCKEDCGTCLGYTQCHHINGTCLQGCHFGYEGILCKTKCSPWKFGKNCAQNCSENCVKDSIICKGTTGECMGGCRPGWEGLQCNMVCLDRKYGENCSQSCGRCKGHKKCHHVYGTCFDGCDRGFNGMLCGEECESQYHGYNCADNCSTACVNQTCNSIDGTCLQMMTVQEQKVGPEDINLVPILGGVVGVALACLLVVVILLMLRRYRSQEQGRKTQGVTQTKTNDSQEDFNTVDEKRPSPSKNREIVYMNSENKKPQIRSNLSHGAEVDEYERIHSEHPYRNDYLNEMVIPDIHLDKLESKIWDERENNDDGFMREYATLPYGEQYSCEAGKKGGNEAKNRFKTTFPYDHSRIILKTGVDYINANYIEGAERNKEYIAAQGPKENTISDFWTMVWQENVSVIVMVTNLEEGDVNKCAKYWPDPDKHSRYRNVSIKMVEEKHYAFYTVRKLTVIHKETKNTRLLTQYQYTAWPDHGTPDPLCLVVFHNHVTRTKTNQINSPVVVHCSAGIGRTGTYIAIDILDKLGRKRGKVNVAECVKRMRENRMNMVQTYEQYIAIFLALNEIVKSPIEISTVAEFTTRAVTMTTDKLTNQSLLRKEFQRLQKIRPKYTSLDYKLARESRGDISTHDILPLDTNSVFLSSAVPHRGNFINAIAVPSYTNSKAFIVTQFPQREDAVDFLRLLVDHESDNVICMNPLKDIGSTAAWLPPRPSSSKSLSPYTVHYKSKSGSDVISTYIDILHSEEKVHKVAIIEPKINIKTSGSSTDTSQLRSLVTAALGANTQHPITIVSSNGAYLCGVFCAVHNVIQQIALDDVVDVFTAVRQLHTRRPQFCANLDEYRLVVKAVSDHIQSSTENIYYNQ